MSSIWQSLQQTYLYPPKLSLLPWKRLNINELHLQCKKLENVIGKAKEDIWFLVPHERRKINSSSQTHDREEDTSVPSIDELPEAHVDKSRGMRGGGCNFPGTHCKELD